MKNKIVAIITARGGSKGLPRKNVLELNGKPLIAHTIDTAFETGIFETVVVTTDDDEIKTVALKHNAYVIDRPQALAQDNSSSLDVIEHALLALKEKGLSYEYFFLLQPTSPLRSASHIQEAWGLYQEMNRVGSVVSVTDEEHTPYKLLLKDADEEAYPLFDWCYLTQPRQLLPKTYRMNGAIYLSAVDDFLKTKSLFSKPLRLYNMDLFSSTDIDSIEDFNKVNDYLKENLNNLF